MRVPFIHSQESKMFVSSHLRWRWHVCASDCQPLFQTTAQSIVYSLTIREQKLNKYMMTHLKAEYFFQKW